ncbi:MAG: acetylxylan esterase [Anaerolineae bacterium]|nr:acetylxylan esterase [Anaerolineae bacterium]
MPLYDKPLHELVAYDPPLTREPDFDVFWEQTLAEAAQAPLNVTMTPVQMPIVGAEVYEVYYDGWRGARICGWYLCPPADEPLPALVQYHGYSGSKGDVFRYLMWALQGYAVLAVDTRGQSGMSTDPGPYTGGHVKGWMTQGITDPQEYYYRGAYVDAVRALDCIQSRPEVDASRIGIMGMSQGGGLTLAVASLDRRPAVALPEMPYLCHYKRAVDMAVRLPYLEIADYIRHWPEREAQVWRTLSYFDNMNLAERIACPVLMDVGLQDDICPPSSVYAAYNKITAPKEMRVYPYHNHEIVEAHWDPKMRWAHHYLKGLDTLQ